MIAIVVGDVLIEVCNERSINERSVYVGDQLTLLSAVRWKLLVRTGLITVTELSRVRGRTGDRVK